MQEQQETRTLLEVQLVPAGLAPMRRMTEEERIRLREAKARADWAGQWARHAAREPHT